MKNELYIGLDVHKETIYIAIATSGRGGEVRAYGQISNDLHAMEKFVGRMRREHGKEVILRFCYEAGPCGYVLARRFQQWAIDCIVVAPSKIARKSGDKIKTDRRDAEMLARLLRAGDLRGIYIPEPTDEVIRDLCRMRTDAVDDHRRARQRMKSFLLQYGYQYKGKANWTDAHMRYLRELVLPHPAMKAILEESLTAIEDSKSRIKRCEATMQDLLQSWQLKPAVEALMAFKGFQIVAAMITVSELGSLHRFEHPRELMSYLGLVPSEKSTGAARKQGAITKCGNPHARWLLIDHWRLGCRRGDCRRQPRGRDERERASQCSQHYATPPKVSKELSKRQAGQPGKVIKTSWEAQNRLHRRFMRLMGRRIHRNKALVAVARELIAFIWDALRELPCYRERMKTELQAGVR